MCNLYSITKGQDAIRQLARAMRDKTGNMPSMPGVFPDFTAPIVRTAAHGVRELAMVHWGMPSSRHAILEAASKRADNLRAEGGQEFEQVLRMEPDGGTTNVRNEKIAHWRPFLGPANRRCP